MYVVVVASDGETSLVLEEIGEGTPPEGLEKGFWLWADGRARRLNKQEIESIRDQSRIVDPDWDKGFDLEGNWRPVPRLMQRVKQVEWIMDCELPLKVKGAQGLRIWIELKGTNLVVNVNHLTRIIGELANEAIGSSASARRPTDDMGSTGLEDF